MTSSPSIVRRTPPRASVTQRYVPGVGIVIWPVKTRANPSVLCATRAVRLSSVPVLTGVIEAVSGGASKEPSA